MKETVAPVVKKPRTGIRALKRRIELRGLAVVDKRSAGAKALFFWRDELLAAVGGEDVSPQKVAIIDMAVRTKLYIDHIDSFLMELPTIIARRKRALFPVVVQRQQLCDSLTRMLGQLGLEKQMKKVEDLDEYFARKAKEKEEAIGAEAQEVEPGEEEPGA